MVPFIVLALFGPPKWPHLVFSTFSESSLGLVLEVSLNTVAVTHAPILLNYESKQGLTVLQRQQHGTTLKTLN